MNCRYAKFLLFAAFDLLILGAAPLLHCNNVVVSGQPSPPIRLRQMARIRVTLDNKPAPGVEIVVWKIAPVPRIVASLVADAKGTTAMPKLPAGSYSIGPPPAGQPWYGGSLRVCIIPCADDPFETTDFVQESLDGPLQPINRDEGALSEIHIELGPTGDLALLGLIHSAERQPVIRRLSALRGVVQDQSGAVIPGAWIDVVADGAEVKRIVLLSADRAGRFSADLPSGDYVAIISSPGFRVRAVAFTIDQMASPGEIGVELEVGSTT